MSIKSEAKKANSANYTAKNREVDELEKAIRQARRAYLNAKAENDIAVNKAMEEMVIVASTQPMTAREISALTNGRVSKMEVVGNLFQLPNQYSKGNCSRNEYLYHSNVKVEIIHTTCKWALLDDNGNPTNIIKETEGVNKYKVIR